MNNVIKLKTPLTGAIPPRFNSAEDDRLELPKLFRYTLSYDDKNNLWHLYGKIVANGKLVNYQTSEYSKIRAIAFYHQALPDLRVVH